MRILRLSITALVAIVAVSGAILLSVKIQEEPPAREVSMTAPAAAAPAPTTSTSTSTSTSTTTTEAPTTTTTTWLPVPTTAVPVPTLPPAPTTTWVEPVPEPEYVPEPEPQYEPTGSGCVIPAYICQRESGMSYTALNASSGAGGMYQFMPSTWNGIARQIAPEWVGTPPHTAPPWVQDMFATYLWDGGAGCYHWSAC